MTTNDVTTTSTIIPATMNVTAVYVRSEGWVSVQLLELPGAISQGRTVEEARANVLEAAKALLESYALDKLEPEIYDVIGTESLTLDTLA